MSSPGEDKHRAFTPSASPPVQASEGESEPPSNSGDDLDASREHLVYAFGLLSVRKNLPMAEHMFLLLGDFFQHAVETHGIDLGLADWHDALRRANENSRRGDRDIRILRWIRTVLDLMRLSSPEDLTQAASILADGSRDALLDVLANPIFEAGPLLPYTCNLLSFSTFNVDLTGCPNHSLQTIMRLMQQPEARPGDMLIVVHTVSMLLQQERFRVQFVDQNKVTIFLDELVGSYTYDILEFDTTEEEISILRNAITQTLADVSATNVFARSYGIDSPVVSSLIQWLSLPHEQLWISSCLVLGNLARSDAICLEMVRRLGLHRRLLELVQDQPDMQVAYAALGFLRNLALPAENKNIIGNQQSVQTISSFWSMDLHPQVQHTSVALLRQLLNNCIGNVRWLLESLSPDQDSPAHEKTYLSLLLLLFGRTDDVSTQVEIGRTVATICRCIASSSQGLPPESTNAILHRLYGMHADIARPLAMMVSQSRFPIIRSEGWFALALMARSREGTAAVGEALQQMEVFGALVTAITGQPTNGHTGTTERRSTGPRLSDSSSGSETRSEREREMQAKDRENALVLVNELLRNTVRIDFLFVSVLRRLLSH
ncbi:MAG: hypothetical protein Q9170_002645 [Blastenia crenularia]